MLDDLQSLLVTLQNPSMFHAAVVHFPIALSILTIPLIYGGIAADSKALRATALGAFSLLTITAFVAVRSGVHARDKVPNTLPKEIWDHINRHAAMAEAVWIFGVIGAVLMAMSLVEVKRVRTVAQWLALGFSLGVSGWVGMVGHLGGTLLYEHGIGTPGLVALHSPPDTPVVMVPENDAAMAQGVSLEASWANPVDDGLTPKRLPFQFEEAQAVKFAEIDELLEFYCHECHRERRAEGGLDLTSVEGMLAGGKKAGASIIPGDPDASPIVKYIRGEMQPQMPEDEEPLPDEDLHLLRMWIAAGAKAE